MPSLSRDGAVFLLDLGSDENRFSPDWLREVGEHVDAVAAEPAPRALVTTATGKFFSNGLDLDWLGEHPDEIGPYVRTVCDLLARVLELGVPSVAALQGHTFAAGAMLSLAHDFRVMRADRGFWCLPEVDIRIPFTVGMDALIRARLSKATAHEAMTTGRRYGGHDALAAGIVHEAVEEERVVAAAVERAAGLAAKDPETLGRIKARMYVDALAALRSEANALGS